MNPDIVTFIWSISEQLITLPTTYFFLKPFYDNEDISRRVYVVLLLLSIALGVALGVVRLLVPQVKDFLFVGSGVITVAIMLVIFKRQIMQFLALFFFSEFFNYTMVNLAFVVDAWLGGDAALASDILTWPGMIAQWALVAVEYAVFHAMILRQNMLLLEKSGNDLGKLFWHIAWFVPMATYVIEVMAVPYDTAILRQDGMILQATLLMFVLVVLLFVMMLFGYEMVRAYEDSMQKSRENGLMRLRLHQASVLQERIETTRKARHDLRHFQNAVADVASRGDVEAMRALSRELETVVDRDPLVWCENSSANAVIDFYVQKARDFGAVVEVHANVPQDCGFEDLKLYSLLGNLLENAVEALKSLAPLGVGSEGSASLEGNASLGGSASQENMPPVLKIKVDATTGNKLVVDIRNTFAGDLVYSDDGVLMSTKHDGAGIGTENVRYLAENAGGFARFEEDEGLFRAFVVVP